MNIPVFDVVLSLLLFLLSPPRRPLCHGEGELTVGEGVRGNTDHAHSHEDVPEEEGEEGEEEGEEHTYKNTGLLIATRAMSLYVWRGSSLCTYAQQPY